MIPKHQQAVIGRREMNRMFDDVFRGFDVAPFGLGSGTLDGLGWPQIDIEETDKEVRITAELPGLALRFAQEVRGADGYFREIPEIKLPAEMMNLAQHIIRTKSDKFDPAMLEDHYRTALVRILRKKQEKRPAHHTPVMQPPRENVVSVMDALRRSIAAERPAGQEKRATSKGAARHRKAS